jgi:tetratricopeptide (TPR) repeat protein
MTMVSYQYPYHDPSIAALIEQLSQELNDLADRIEEVNVLAQKGIPLKEAHGLSAARRDDLYATASQLCDEGEFRHALPIALYLCVQHGRDPRFSFIAGACCQRIGMIEAAAAMYGISLLLDGSQAAAMYRLGECFSALGRKDEAIEAFEATIDLGRASDKYRRLQDWAMSKRDRLQRAR